MSIGERLREERIRLGLSQAELGEAGGVQKQAQLKYEKGERQPDALYLEGVAGRGVDVLYVLTGRRPIQSQTQVQYSKGSVVALPVSENGGLTWREVLVIAVDALNSAGRALPGAKLAELVDLLMEFQRSGAKLDVGAVRAQIRLVV